MGRRKARSPAVERQPEKVIAPMDRFAPGKDSQPIAPDSWKHREEYLRQRQSLDESLKDGAKQHDAAILALSSGAFGISLTFIEKIAPDPSAWTLPFLGAAWTCLVLSIALILASFLTSQRACSRQIEILDQDYRDQHTDVLVNNRNRWSSVTTYLNRLTYLSLVGGLALIALFAFINVKEKNVSDSQNKPITTSGDDGSEKKAGYVPPSAPVPIGKGVPQPPPPKEK